MKGFTVDLEPYCCTCPEFEVAVNAMEYTYEDMATLDETKYYSRELTCVHMDKCRSIYKQAKKDIRNEGYKKEYTDERREKDTDGVRRFE